VLEAKFLGRVALAGSALGQSLDDLIAQLKRCSQKRREYGQLHDYWKSEGEPETARHYLELYEEMDQRCKKIQKLIEQKEGVQKQRPTSMTPSSGRVTSSASSFQVPTRPFPPMSPQYSPTTTPTASPRPSGSFGTSPAANYAESFPSTPTGSYRPSPGGLISTALGPAASIAPGVIAPTGGVASMGCRIPVLNLRKRG